MSAGATMTFVQSTSLAGAIVLAGATLSQAQTALSIVNVAAPAVLCVFEANCTVTGTDTTGTIPLNFASGTPILQSRTFGGAAGTPAAGLTAYEYRVDMTTAAGAVDCQLGVVIDFGPVAKLPYAGSEPADVYVITSGGLGSVGLTSAEQDGGVITFTFDKPLCVGNAAGQGMSTFFFGLASAKPPAPALAGMWGFGVPPFVSLAARAPEQGPSPPSGLRATPP